MRRYPASPGKEPRLPPPSPVLPVPPPLAARSNPPGEGKREKRRQEEPPPPSLQLGATFPLRSTSTGEGGEPTPEPPSPKGVEATKSGRGFDAPIFGLFPSRNIPPKPRKLRKD
ncbi:PREDICTED: wiskott-Aldrich syndrome protein-like [Calidris pugnax]|uniref:wiskott-Aldrich syndrome protein-like n=1 Tax=Calidris pugnax TaxID=198806 RepID=UPI00071DE671|nr:PREDICTED: wiskott-Aldrich syndrome protein-like [Calidris pugnax]